MAARYSTDSSPTVVAPPAGVPKAPSTPPSSSSASSLDGDPSVDTQALYRTSPALTFPRNLLYAIAQFSLVLVLLPYHFVLFALVPRRRWRASWTLTDAALMPAVKRIMSTMDTCGYKIGARRTDAAPGAVGRWWIRVRHGVRFEWVDGLESTLVGGVLADDQVRVRDKVGVYSWTREGVDEREGLVGLWLHGGAYTHNSAHPGASSSAIPSTIFKREPRFSSIHAVEYRLLPDSPFPAALQDAAAAYVSLLRRGVRGSQVVVMGDSSGGHLALALTRWVKETREERGPEWEEEGGWKLEEPAGLVLFSPWTDPSHSYLGHTASTYVPRKNSSDYIFESPQFRLHLVTSLLGSRPSSFVLSPYLSPGARSLALGALAGFPPTFVHYGTSDRCEEEGERLVRHLERDGVRVDKVVTADTPHDLMLLATVWNKRQVEQVWEGVLRFTSGLGR
ncbi:hypothetical protein JCM3775_001518 [Rhodotorula graminis]|uniref:Alpha/beta hydrolase fold-3 domain-containing protein n=1 Tax=Rhodotorula graminis (strain WP1) TaxID=578459 RepID=A0A0P9F225_RHOGW|nr:uncharacterized protein RHOBADRAFT_54937 [Rhodotorula graminis WP1]KPV73752.1 hypothetical protein RHOBADRAFT_54937 [Rhodotorula graminis WP1]